MPTVWRVIKKQYAGMAFDGEGARLHGGRWTSRGVPVAYASQHASLALLEVLVHLEDVWSIPRYVAMSATFDDSLVASLDEKDLPEDWRNSPAPNSLKSIGDDWCDRAASAVLRIPSVIVPFEDNFLINPRHPHFDHIRLSLPQPLGLDTRLLHVPSSIER